MKKLKKNLLKLDKEVISSLSESDLSFVKGGELNSEMASCLCSTDNNTVCVKCNLHTLAITQCVNKCQFQSDGQGGVVQVSCNPNDSCICLHSQGAGCVPSETCVNPDLTKEGCHIL